MKKLDNKAMAAVRGGGGCVSPAAPHLGDCPGMCHASMVVLLQTGSGIGVDNLVCIV